MKNLLVNSEDLVQPASLCTLMRVFALHEKNLGCCRAYWWKSEGLDQHVLVVWSGPLFFMKNIVICYRFYWWWVKVWISLHACPCSMIKFFTVHGKNLGCCRIYWWIYSEGLDQPPCPGNMVRVVAVHEKNLGYRISWWIVKVLISLYALVVWSGYLLFKRKSFVLKNLLVNSEGLDQPACPWSLIRVFALNG